MAEGGGGGKFYTDEELHKLLRQMIEDGAGGLIRTNQPNSIQTYKVPHKVIDAPTDKEWKDSIQKMYGAWGLIRRSEHVHFKFAPEKIKEADKPKWYDLKVKPETQYSKVRKYIKNFLTKLFIIILTGLGMYGKEE